jgi:hypothetical protein
MTPSASTSRPTPSSPLELRVALSHLDSSFGVVNVLAKNNIIDLRNEPCGIDLHTFFPR